jgi:hypothetical protein
MAGLGAAGIFASGALLGHGLDAGWLESGRGIAGAWGFGVIALPVPAGLGIRELYLSLVDPTGVGAALALTHRSLTIVADILLGVAGLALVRRGPSGTGGRSRGRNP